MMMTVMINHIVNIFYELLLYDPCQVKVTAFSSISHEYHVYDINIIARDI